MTCPGGELCNIIYGDRICPCERSLAAQGIERVTPDWMCSPEDEEFHFAQGTEAGTATTVEQGVVHDGPVAKPCAQTPGGGGK